MTRSPYRTFKPAPGTQQGFVLYIALIMLILLSLIGIVGMQVAGLQEKMSANYRNGAMAFQNADAAARRVECYVESVANADSGGGCSGGTTVAIEELCEVSFDPAAWAEQQSLSGGEQYYARAIGNCITGNANIGMGFTPESETANPVYQVTAYSTDYTLNPTIDAAIDTVFRP